jgi:diguanylate cyclase (GGDEF)-like protein/PAS domain S-box-containing protein
VSPRKVKKPERTAKTPIRKRRPSSSASLKDPWTLSKFLHDLQEGVYITNADGRILDANRAFLRMFGVRSLRELQRYTTDRLVADHKRHEEERVILSEKGFVREFEMEIRRVDGEVRTVLDTGYQVTDPDTWEVLYHGILVDITDRKRLEEELSQAAVRDPLTGCFNRRYLAGVERELVGDSRRWGAVVVDIDHFKDYNDRYGHHIGDRVLIRVGRFLMGEVRADDAVVRIGGDEFLVVLTETPAERTEEVAMRLRWTSAEALPVSLSVGWAVRQRREGLAITVRRADRQLIRTRVRERRPQLRRRADDPPAPV